MPFVNMEVDYPKPISRQAEKEEDRQAFFERKMRDFETWRRSHAEKIPEEHSKLMDETIEILWGIAPGVCLDLLASLGKITMERRGDTK